MPYVLSNGGIMKPEKRRAELYPTGGVWFGGRLSRTVLRTAVAFVVAAAMLVPALPAVADEGAPADEPSATAPAVGAEEAGAEASAKPAEGDDPSEAEEKPADAQSAEAGTPAAVPTPAPAAAPGTPAETPADAEAAEPNAPSEPSAEAAVQQDVWVDGTSGDDSAMGADQSTALKTMAKALEVQKAHAEIKTIHITGSFTDWTKVEVPQGVTLRVEGAVSVAGNPGTAIALTSGSRMESAAGASLSMSLGDGNTAIDIAKNAVLSDGDYHFTFPKNGSAFRLVGDVIGSAAGAVKMDITNGYFQSYNYEGHLNNMVLN